MSFYEIIFNELYDIMHTHMQAPTFITEHWAMLCEYLYCHLCACFCACVCVCKWMSLYYYVLTCAYGLELGTISKSIYWQHIYWYWNLSIFGKSGTRLIFPSYQAKNKHRRYGERHIVVRFHAFIWCICVYMWVLSYVVAGSVKSARGWYG